MSLALLIGLEIVAPDGNFPTAALDADRTGQVVLECTLAAVGRVENCKVVREDPPGYDFGATALRLAAQMRMSDKSQDGSTPPIGSVVQVPFRFAIQYDAPPAPAPRTKR